MYNWAITGTTFICNADSIIKWETIGAGLWKKYKRRHESGKILCFYKSGLRLYWICKCLISCQEIRAKDPRCNSKVSVSPATRRGTIRKSLTQEPRLSGDDQICNIDESEVIKRCKCNQENLEAGTRDCDRISWSLLKTLWLNLIISLRHVPYCQVKKKNL